jgi:hypothetical protein
MPKENAIEARAHRLLLDLARGRVDRDDLALDASEVFPRQAINDIRQNLASLGNLERVRLDSTQSRGGAKHYALTLVYQSGNCKLRSMTLPVEKSSSSLSTTKRDRGYVRPAMRLLLFSEASFLSISQW